MSAHSRGPINCRRLLPLTAALLFSAIAQAAQFTSGPAQTTLLELYTSEGCNSCPPAEAHLNRYTQHRDLWTRIVPLALHVDYWDGLGWKDRYADPTHAERQRRYSHLWSTRTIYTPAFIANGSSWRPGMIDQYAPVSDHDVGQLSVSLIKGQVVASMMPVAPLAGRLRLNIAILGMDLNTAIHAGENGGRQATHQFVVLGMAHTSSDNAQWKLALPKARLAAKRYALAAWVSREDDPTPIQSTGGFLTSEDTAGSQ